MTLEQFGSTHHTVIWTPVLACSGVHNFPILDAIDYLHATHVWPSGLGSRRMTKTLKFVLCFNMLTVLVSLLIISPGNHLKAASALSEIEVF